MHEKWGLRNKPYISWLGSHTKLRKRTNAIRLEERKSSQKPAGDDIDQFRVMLPNLSSDMPLVLVLVQDSSLELNLAGGSSQNRLAPPTPSSKLL
jgi:hypothetical protein